MKTLFTIWTKPGETFKYLDKCEDEDLGLRLDILFFLGSLAIAIPNMVNSSFSMGDYKDIYLILGLLFTGLLGFLLFKFVTVFIFWVFGRVLQGKATKHQIRIVLAYVMVPGLINLAISLILIIVAIIIKDIAVIGYQNPFTQVVIWIFGFRILIIGLSRFNAYTYGYAIINTVLVQGLALGLLYGIRYLFY